MRKLIRKSYLLILLCSLFLLGNISAQSYSCDLAITNTSPYFSTISPNVGEFNFPNALQNSGFFCLLSSGYCSTQIIHNSGVYVSGTSGIINFIVPENTSAQPKVHVVVFYSEPTEAIQIYFRQPAGQGCNLSGSPASRTFNSALSVTSSFYINSDYAWTASDNRSWITLNTTSGNGNGNLSFSVTTNTSSSARSGTIYVNCSGETKSFTVSQAGASSCEISVNPGYALVGYCGGSKSVSVNASGAWSVDSKPSWVNINSTGSGGLSFSCGALPANLNQRYGQIYVECTVGGERAHVDVVQDRSFGCNYGYKVDPKNADTRASDPEAKVKPILTKASVYPNPFSSVATISFELDTSADVSLEVRDMTGKLIRQVLTKKPFAEGKYKQRIDGYDLASGMYFYRLMVNDEVQTGKMILKK